MRWSTTEQTASGRSFLLSMASTAQSVHERMTKYQKERTDFETAFYGKVLQFGSRCLSTGFAFLFLGAALAVMINNSTANVAVLVIQVRSEGIVFTHALAI
jgi:hypothetical protein